MSWPLGAVDRLPWKVSATLDGTIRLGTASVTESNGWVQLRATTTRGGPRAFDVRVRLRLSVDAAARPFLYAEQVEFDGRRFAGLHQASAVVGDATVAQIASLVLSKFTHFAIRRTDKHTTVSETREAVREERSLGADDTWQPGGPKLAAVRGGG
jgi:hypothetical protein